MVDVRHAPPGREARVSVTLWLFSIHIHFHKFLIKIKRQAAQIFWVANADIDNSRCLDPVL